MASVKNLALSPSRANDYKQCPLMYRLKTIDKIPEPKTIAQVKGTLVHAVLENIHQLPREERTYPAAVKMLKPEWAKMTEQDPQLDELVPSEELLDFLVEARTLVRGYFEMENPQGFDAESVEEFVNVTLPNGVPVRGFIDRVDVSPGGHVRVVDYKTGKKPIPRFSAHALFQMKFYALVWWRLHGAIPAQLRLMYLKVADDMVMQPSPAELQYFERDLRELWDSILADLRSGHFKTKTSRLCDWCSFKDSLCPEFGGTSPAFPELEGMEALN